MQKYTEKTLVKRFLGSLSVLSMLFWIVQIYFIGKINDVISAWTKFCPYENWATFEKNAQKLLKLHKICYIKYVTQNV